jgi:protein-tyrosine sulfotransferase
MVINYIRSRLRRLIKGEYHFYDQRGYKLSKNELDISENGLKTAKLIRGENRLPSIILHGVMFRSGTTYVGELLGLHPDLYKYPNEILEFPFLRLAGDISQLHDNFLVGYQQNQGKITENDFSLLFGSSIIAHLYSFVPETQRMFLKIPNVQFLDRFYTLFPFEDLIVLNRDGRDVVSSAMKTWPNLSFSDVCHWWANSARMILACNERYSSNQGYYYARYEDIMEDPTIFIKAVCSKFGLDEKQYPYAKINDIPVIGSSILKNSKKVDWNPIEKPIDFKPIGRWHGWTRIQKSIFKRIAGESLLALGYCNDLNW